MSKKMDIADYDAKIKQLQAKKKAALIAERKRIAAETKIKEARRNEIVYAVFKDYLNNKGIDTDLILGTPLEGLREMIFNMEKRNVAKPSAGAQGITSSAT